MAGDSEAVEPWAPRVSDATLEDLRERLARTRWPDALPDAGWDYGTELAYLQELCEHWRERFDWRTHEERLESFGSFATTIDGQRIHLLHAPSEEANALPLLLLHGWPGSLFEFAKVIGPLRDPVTHGGRAEDAFHVVCPALPGYGFSGPTREAGWDVQRVAEAFIALVRRLGYERYGVQGGDWGAIVATQMGRLDPERCAGLHLNMPMTLPPAEPEAREGLSEKERAWVAESEAFRSRETAYMQIQATKPQTLAYGLADSPAGLAGWIVEKFRTWSDCDGHPESRFHRDELLANVTLYWVTETIHSSIRLYCESMQSGRLGFTQGRVEVPTGCAIFPKEIYKHPRSWLERTYNVTHWTEMPRGGHFAAMEEPELLVADVRDFFRTVR